MGIIRTASASMVLSILVGTATLVSARCDPSVDPDKTDIANARAAVAANCDCAGATSHGAYVSCATQQIDATLVNRTCRGRAKKCAAASTCGKPGFVTCCRTKNGKDKCNVTKPDMCLKKGGTEGSCTSCCDACPTPGGGASCPTTTSSVTTTTSSVEGGIKCCLRTVQCGPFSNCQITTSQDCVAAGGIALGPGDCSAPNACAQATTTTPPFACCLPNAQCVMTGSCECGAAGGQFKFFQFCGSPQDPCVTTTTVICPTTTTLGVPSCGPGACGFPCLDGRPCTDPGDGQCICTGTAQCGGASNVCGGECSGGLTCTPLTVPMGCPSIGCSCQ